MLAPLIDYVVLSKETYEEQAAHDTEAPWAGQRKRRKLEHAPTSGGSSSVAAPSDVPTSTSSSSKGP